MNNLYIPQKLKVGFQERKDTFTGKLAYVIYYDHKNVLRKEKSWKSWITDKIETIELDNEPRSGYIINKGVQRDGYWGSGRSVIRVYDPRDFEFEIDVTNLVGILMHSEVSKCDIAEECVFAWRGNNLVLLPVNSQEYQNGLEHTKKQKQSISTKELVPGYQYSRKSSDEVLTYIGYYKWYQWEDISSDSRKHTCKGKKHVFYNGKEFITPSISSLSSVLNEEVVDNYAELLIDFTNSYLNKQVIGFEIVPISKKEMMDSYSVYKSISNYEFIQLRYNPYYLKNNKPINLNILGTNFCNGSLISNIETMTHYGYTYSLYARTPTKSPKLIDLATTLQYDINNLTSDQFYDLLVKANYGKLQYILEK